MYWIMLHYLERTITFLKNTVERNDKNAEVVEATDKKHSEEAIAEISWHCNECFQSNLVLYIYAEIYSYFVCSLFLF